MDERIESFLADVLALAGEDLDAVREAVRVALADCEAIFRAQEPNKRMKDKAAHACHALCREICGLRIATRDMLLWTSKK